MCVRILQYYTAMVFATLIYFCVSGYYWGCGMKKKRSIIIIFLVYSCNKQGKTTFQEFSVRLSFTVWAFFPGYFFSNHPGFHKSRTAFISFYTVASKYPLHRLLWRSVFRYVTFTTLNWWNNYSLWVIFFYYLFFSIPVTQQLKTCIL